jgi:gas vesicle protein
VKETVSEAASGIKGRAGELAGDVSELRTRAEQRVGKFRGQASRQARRVKTNLEHAAKENPVIVAIGATIAGLTLGLLLPGTERENEVMGSTRDQLMDRAEKTAERVKDAAAEAGHDVKETVKAEIAERAPEVKEAVQQAGQAVKDQVKESAKKVKREAKDAVKEPGANPRSGT